MSFYLFIIYILLTLAIALIFRILMSFTEWIEEFIDYRIILLIKFFYLSFKAPTWERYMDNWKEPDNGQF